MRKLGRGIARLLDPWIDALVGSREHLVSCLRGKGRNLIEDASRWHLETAIALRQRVRELVRAMRVAKNPLGPEDLTELIFEFRRLREQVYRESVIASHLRKRGGKLAREAEKAAAESEQALREFTKHLHSELDRLGMLTPKLSNKLGLEEWL